MIEHKYLLFPIFSGRQIKDFRKAMNELFGSCKIQIPIAFEYLHASDFMCL